MAAGRPLKFQTVEELQARIDAYFESCAQNITFDVNGNPQPEPLTITGLALALGSTRQTILEYGERDEFTDAIKTAKTKIENYAEKRLFTTGSPTGAIFALKNYGWKDSQDLNHGGQPDNPLKTLIMKLDGTTSNLPSEREE